MVSIASQRADRLARVGLLGAYTLLARRAGRPDFQPSGRSGGPTSFRSEAFGFAARLPAGWVRQCIESLHVAQRGLLLFQEIEVYTPEGVRIRVGSSIEPSLPSDGAIDELVRVLGGSAGGRIVADEGEGDDPRVRDLTIFGEDRTLAVARVAIAGRRVLCADAWLDDESGDEVVRRFFDDLVLVDIGDPADSRPSGTYRAPRAED
jgi:hypothetical protein